MRSRSTPLSPMLSLCGVEVRGRFPFLSLSCSLSLSSYSLSCFVLPFSCTLHLTFWIFLLLSVSAISLSPQTYIISLLSLALCIFLSHTFSASPTLPSPGVPPPSLPPLTLHLYIYLFLSSPILSPLLVFSFHLLSSMVSGLHLCNAFLVFRPLEVLYTTRQHSHTH